MENAILECAEPKARTSNDLFICNSGRALNALKFWLRERPAFNSARDNLWLKKRPCIGLGFEDKDEADATRFTDAGLITCPTEEMRKQAMVLVERAIRQRAAQGGPEP